MGWSSREVEQHTFSTSIRGYDRKDVDSFKADLAKHLSTQEERLAIAEAKAARAKEELDRLNDILESRIAEAQRARDAIISEAKQEAEQIMAAAETGGGQDTAGAAGRAAAIISEAETKASLRLSRVDEITEKARTEADRIVRSAEQDVQLKLAEADRIVDTARRDAKGIRTDTERAHTEIESQLAELRRIVTAVDDADGDLSGISVVLRDGSDIVVDLRAASPVPEPQG